MNIGEWRRGKQQTGNLIEKWKVVINIILQQQARKLLKKTLTHILYAVYILVLIPNVQCTMYNIQKLYKNLFTEAKFHRQTNTSIT
jgi:hypothetical protein